MTRETKKAAASGRGNGNGNGKHGARSGHAPDPEALAAANEAQFNALLQASEAMLTGMAAIGQEMVQFAQTRLRENMTLSGAVMQCSDPNEAFRIECDYARSATQQYLDEAGKIMGLTADLSQRSWAPIEALTRDALTRLNVGR